MRKVIILTIVFTAAFCDGATITVNPEGAGDYTTIQAAIDAAAELDTVVVGEGSYEENINIGGKNIVLTSTEPDDWCVVNATIINGVGNGCVVTFGGGETAECLVEGFTITGGYNDTHGGGIQGNGSYATVKRCVIRDNETLAYGGGIQNFNGEVSHCMIKRNIANVGGAFAGVHGRISNCLIADNRANLKAGAMNNCDGDILNCTIISNSADVEGAVRVCDGRLINCILWHNSPEGFYNCTADVSYSCYPKAEGESNINADPLLAFESDGHITKDSPCIDSGTSDVAVSIGEYDVEGSQRLFDGDGDGQAEVDIGAYEFNAESACIAVSRSVLEFTTYEGCQAQEQTIQIKNCGAGVLDWRIKEEMDWFCVEPQEGDSQGEADTVAVSINTSSFSAGIYEGMFLIEANKALNSPLCVVVRLVVKEPVIVPDDYPTIQSAVDAAEDGGLVLIRDGVYSGEGNRDIVIYNKSLTIKSENGAGGCIIYYKGDEDERVEYIFNIPEVEAKSVTIEGISIISNGVYSAIGCRSGGHTIKDCIFINEGVGDDIYWAGGAVGCYFSGDELIKIKGCSFVSCSSWIGAGIFCEASTVLVEDCLFLDNTSHSGGAIYCMTEEGASDMTVKNCTFSGNESFGDGGAVYCGGSSEIKLMDCKFNDNTAKYFGGAFYCGGTGTVENCRMMGNKGSNGGAISTDEDGNVVVSRSVIKQNEAVVGGGVFIMQVSKCAIDNCLIAENHSDNRGGGVRARSMTSLMITDSTICNNSADEGGGLFVPLESTCIVSNSIIWGNSADIGAQVYSLDSYWPVRLFNCDTGNAEGIDIEGPVEMKGCIHEEPLFTGPDEYSLQSGSPCIDSGNNEYLTGYSDVRGQYRPLDGDLDGTAATDIGAYEFCPEGESVIQCSAERVCFTYFIGGGAAEQTIIIRNSGEGLLNWTIIEEIPWLYAEPASGTADAEGIEVVLSVHPAFLEEGVYCGSLSIIDAEAINSPFEIDVYLCMVGNGLWVPYNHATIQDAIDEAQEGQTVFVADGLYTGYRNQNISFLGKKITVRSVTGAENCIIDCQTDAYEQHGFNFYRGEDENSVLDGFTITGAYDKAIRCLSSKPTIRNCVLRDNAATGIECTESAPVIDNCRFTRNSRFGDVSGISVLGGSEPVRVSNCAFVYNHNYFGGGSIKCVGGNIIITDSIMKFNEGREPGAGVFIEGGSGILERCIIEGNSCLGKGGGVCSFAGELTVKDSIIRINRSSRGGGIFARDSSVQIMGSEVCDNEVFESEVVPLGGGIYCYGSEVTISGCEIKGNYSEQTAGGVHLRKSSGQMANNLIAGNACGYDGGGIYIDGAAGDIAIDSCTIVENRSLENPGGGFANLTTEGTISMTNCILWNNSPEQIITSLDNLAVDYCDIQGGWEGEGNIDADPLFVDLNNGDFHLSLGSPCIDAGDPEYPFNPDEVDLGGALRMVDGDGDGEVRVDMGAYEYVPPVVVVPIDVKITPSVLNVNSHGQCIVAHIQMPEGLVVFEEDIETVLLDGLIEAEEVLIGEDKMITARFDRTAVSDYLIDLSISGPIELTVTCRLTDGTVFEGKYTITVRE